MLPFHFLPFLIALFFTTTNVVVAYGDFLNRTMCYCGDDGRNWEPIHEGGGIPKRDIIPTFDDMEEIHEEVGVSSVPSAEHSNPRQAFWIRFDYYNRHLGRTFTMEEECRSNWKRKPHKHEDHGMLSSRKDCLAYHHLHKRYCQKYKPAPTEVGKKHKRKHKFCYHFKRLWEPDINGMKDWDYYEFDQHKRVVPQEGVIIQQLKDVVRQVCEPACKAKFDLPMMEGHWYHRSRVDTIWDQADMCRGCA